MKECKEKNTSQPRNCREGYLITRRPPPRSRWTSGLAEAMIPCPRCEKRVLIRELSAHQKLTCRLSLRHLFLSVRATGGVFFLFCIFLLLLVSCLNLLLHFRLHSPVSYSHVKLCQVVNVSVYLLWRCNSSGLEAWCKYCMMFECARGSRMYSICRVFIYCRPWQNTAQVMRTMYIMNRYTIYSCISFFLSFFLSFFIYLFIYLYDSMMFVEPM